MKKTFYWALLVPMTIFIASCGPIDGDNIVANETDNAVSAKIVDHNVDLNLNEQTSNSYYGYGLRGLYGGYPYNYSYFGYYYPSYVFYLVTRPGGQTSVVMPRTHY